MRGYTVVLDPDPEGGYSVSVPALPGCFTQGETLEEALLMAREAIELHLAGMVADGEPLPDDVQPLLTLVQVDEPATEQVAATP
jgi:predicted RNase H-like HicB family nuclease